MIRKGYAIFTTVIIILLGISLIAGSRPVADGSICTSTVANDHALDR